MTKTESEAVCKALERRECLLAESPFLTFECAPITLRILYSSPNVSRALGYDSQEPSGTFETFLDLLDTNDRQTVVAALSVPDPAGGRDPVVRMRQRDGSLRPMRLCIRRPTSASAPDEPVRLYAVSVDAAPESVHLSEAERGAARLEGALIAGRGAAHAINDLLAEMVGRSEVLLQRFQHTDTPSVDELKSLLRASLLLASRAAQLQRIERVVTQDVQGIGPVLDLDASAAPPGQTSAGAQFPPRSGPC